MIREFSSLRFVGLAIGIGGLLQTAWGASQINDITPGKEHEIRVANAAIEQSERDVDRAAEQAQEVSIRTLQNLLKKYRGTTQEAVFLEKLADLQEQNATIVFRIAHGNAQKNGKSLNLTHFKSEMTKAISYCSELIKKYPKYEDIAHMYFLRGKSFEEIENIPAATQDYKFLVENFPQSEELIPAYMSLAEFAITANDHPTAIRYLKEVEKHPNDLHYPFALYKLAWSYYNLKNIPESLSYAERDVAYYNALEAKEKEKKKAEKSEPLPPSSDSALKESCLLDIPVFYFEGYEENLAQYNLGKALDYFRKLDQSPLLGRMLLRFAKLLRVHDHEADLVAWESQVLDAEPKRPETLDILLTVYENQLNRRQFPQMTENAKNVAKLYAIDKTFESFPKAQKMILDTADLLQTVIIKNKDADDVPKYSGYLASIYESFTHAVDEKDPRIPRVHYNLAETLFTTKDYVGATENYRFVVDHGKWNAKVKDSNQEVSVEDASLKAIAARYEVLRVKKMIPTQVVASSMPKHPTHDPLDPLLQEWVTWLETHLKHSPQHTENTENFVFEANRAIYAQGHIEDAVERLAKFATHHPESKYAVPSASLVVDTWVATEDWQKTLDVANDFQEIKFWKNSEFGKRLFAVAADASYKQIEKSYQNKDYADTLARADQFLKHYSSSERLADCLSTAGNAAFQNGQKDRGLGYYAKLIALPPSEDTAHALLVRAQYEAEAFRFVAATLDYRAYLSLPPKFISHDAKLLAQLRLKALSLAWISGDAGTLDLTLQSKAICTEEIQAECLKYTVIAKISQIVADPNRQDGKATSTDLTDDAFEKARRADSGIKSLWAILALEGAKGLAFRDRLLMIRTLADGWDNLDPLMKFTLLPIMSNSIPRAFKMNRAMMSEVAPLRAEEKYITHRIDMIHEMENAATKTVSLPWARLRAETLNETAGLYEDLSRGLAALPPPKDLSDSDKTAYDETIRKLTVPFEEKGNDLRAKAFEIASTFGIDEESYLDVAGPYFEENPSLAKSLKPKQTFKAPFPVAANIDFTWLDNLDPEDHWKNLTKQRAVASAEADSLDHIDTAAQVRTLWVRAVMAKRWPQIAFFLQISKDKKLFSPPVLSLIQAISLAAVGARAEGFTELEEAVKNLPDPKLKRDALLSLLPLTVHSLSKKHTRDIAKQIDTVEMKPEILTYLQQVSAWAEGR